MKPADLPPSIYGTEIVSRREVLEALAAIEEGRLEEYLDVARTPLTDREVGFDPFLAPSHPMKPKELDE